MCEGWALQNAACPPQQLFHFKMWSFANLWGSTVASARWGLYISRHGHKPLMTVAFWMAAKIRWDWQSGAYCLQVEIWEAGSEGFFRLWNIWESDIEIYFCIVDFSGWDGQSIPIAAVPLLGGLDLTFCRGRHVKARQRCMSQEKNQRKTGKQEPSPEVRQSRRHFPCGRVSAPSQGNDSRAEPKGS